MPKSVHIPHPLIVCCTYGFLLHCTPPPVLPSVCPLRVKAQVLYLSYDAPDAAEDPSSPPSCGQWVPVMKEAVFVALRCVKVSKNTSGVHEGQ